MREPGKVLICGHSHTIALGVRESTDAAGSPLVTLIEPARDNFRGLTHAARDLTYWSAVCSLAETNTVAISWGGNQHLYEFMFKHSTPVDFVCSSHPELDIAVDTLLVPETMVAASFEPSIEPLGQILKIIRDNKFRTPIVLGTPPPRGNNERLLSVIRNETYFVNAALLRGVTIDQVELTPPITRLKAWTLLQRMMSDAAQAQGVPFIPVPTSAQDDIGFLKEEYWSNDASHANGEYGQLVLDQVEQHLGLS